MAGVKLFKIRKLGAGGQGEVWLAREGQSREIVVLKRPLDSLDVSEGSPDRARFEREVRIQSTLRHDGIMPILRIYKTPTGPLFTMPYAETSLEQELSNGPLTETESVDIILTIADAVDFAHSEGVLHRDLKPANILYLNGRWVVSDFGLCRDVNSDSATITRSRTVVGSVAYMAPEQYDDAHEVTESADILSIGRIFYHCLTGRVPFPYFRSELIPAKFRYLVTRAVAEDPSARYQTVSEFRQELELLVTGTPDLTPPMERARALNAESLEGDSEATLSLARLLVEKADDEVFYRDFVPALSIETLSEIEEHAPQEFRQIVAAFDQFSEGSHPFSYTDAIAKFFRNVAFVAPDDDYAIRRRVLRRILIVGASHNRFFVGEMFASIVSNMKEAEDILLVASLLREHPNEARFMGFYLRQHSLPTAIMAALPPE
ncbi:MULTISPECIES: serine/threonine-protein kinase [Streptomyces]|uniref:serine/threonine-protein kinase n=1 Tax=Streptomyces TaxID=1883 RepID=UPI0029B2ACD1|nr:serine/threonine-protein kinase [Streptomyces europaeiscabiei]MDX3587676.1 serine/threonine-protein kinase [Streptomyces europaeiscabiei]MDX3631851.1 serine/threonine-protein kinase [Streptomyces europaeiscabiei]MDX3649632.1 serine/threonine-protein kinase [Streptomyces europaeiscabiei]